MSAEFLPAVELFLLTSAYWCVDRAVRREGLVTLLVGVGLKTPGLQALACVVLCVAASLVWPWSDVPQGSIVRGLAVALSAAMVWKAVTRDLDPAAGALHGRLRFLLVATVAAAWLSPAFLLVIVLLLTTPFALWEHHSTLPMRLLQAIAAWLVVQMAVPATTGLAANTAVLFFFLLTMQISHYLITALAKIWLGPKWYSWATDNQLHHLVANAWSWGWARFLPWRVWCRVVSGMRSIERPVQVAAMTIELLAPLALLHANGAIAFCVAWSLFHAGVFLLSGLLFWDWILTGLAMAAAVSFLPQDVQAMIFGMGSVFASVIFMIIFPLRHKLWKPMPLGWWDTPLTQRMHWRVTGASGTEYGLYNNFMCPYERLYGKVHACFLAPVDGLTYHLGEVWKRELRDAIRSAGPSLDRLNAVRQEFGIRPRDETLAQNHVAWLKRFFHELNCGARKHVLPRWLMWLKAPGDQIFYWGDLPAYRRQEPVRQVTLRYREEYFDGEQLVRLRDELVLTIGIDASAADVECVPEPSPKQIDDLLLNVGRGRLIDLPEFGDGYVQGDDGRRLPAL